MTIWNNTYKHPETFGAKSLKLGDRVLWRGSVDYDGTSNNMYPAVVTKIDPGVTSPQGLWTITCFPEDPAGQFQVGTPTFDANADALNDPLQLADGHWMFADSSAAPSAPGNAVVTP